LHTFYSLTQLFFNSKYDWRLDLVNLKNSNNLIFEHFLEMYLKMGLVIQYLILNSIISVYSIFLLEIEYFI